MAVGDRVMDWLQSIGLFADDEQPDKYEEDYSWVLDAPRIAVRRGLQEAGLPTDSRVVDFWTRRLSGSYAGNQGSGDDMMERLYRAYTTGEGANEDDPNRKGKFFLDMAAGLFNPDLGQQVGFSPAMTGAQASGLIGAILTPESGRQASSDIKTAVLAGDDAAVYSEVRGYITAVGFAAFSERDQRNMTVRLDMLYEKFVEAKYVDKSVDAGMNFLEYLGEVGATILEDVLPGIDWRQVGEAWSAINPLDDGEDKQDDARGGESETPPPPPPPPDEPSDDEKPR